MSEFDKVAVEYEEKIFLLLEKLNEKDNKLDELKEQNKQLSGENELLKTEIVAQYETLINSLSRADEQNNRLETEISELKKSNNQDKSFFKSHCECYLSEIKQLREALRKCSPHLHFQHPEAKCVFCDKEYEDEHKTDCEYVKLTNLKEE